MKHEANIEARDALAKAVDEISRRLDEQDRALSEARALASAADATVLVTGDELEELASVCTFAPRATPAFASSATRC